MTYLLMKYLVLPSIRAMTKPCKRKRPPNQLGRASANAGRALLRGVELRHVGQALDADAGGLAGGAEGFEAFRADFHHAGGCRLQVGARIEIIRLLLEVLADRAG